MTENTVSRRDVLAAGAATAIGAHAIGMLPGTALAGSGAVTRRPGIQLFTLRKSMADDVPGTLRAVAGIGYREVEFAGYGDRPAAEIRDLLDELGLRSPSSHVDARALRDDPAPILDAASRIGNDYVTIGWLQPEDRRSIDDYRRWATAMNRIGTACRERGLRLAYHNHDFELEPLDGQLPFDALLRGTDPELVDFQLDFYWTRKAGLDVVATLDKAAGRITMAHLKDMDADGKMADVGSGTIDFASILADEAAASLRHLFVERDDAPDPFKSAAISRLALESLLESG